MTYPIAEQECWRLTVAYWADAVEAGVTPHKIHTFSLAPDPGGYAEHTFDFELPPTREDFLSVCARLPWTHGWNEGLIPAVERSPWPIIVTGRKAAQTTLRDAQNREVGRLDVGRHRCYRNRGYTRPSMFLHVLGPMVLRGQNTAKIAECTKLLKEHDSSLRELIVSANVPEDYDAQAQILREFLEQRGLLKPKKQPAFLRKAAKHPVREGSERG